MRALIVQWISGCHGKEFRELARLAPRVATPEFVRELIELATQRGGKTGQRAQHALRVLRSRGWSAFIDAAGYPHR